MVVNDDEKECIAKFADQFITCTLKDVRTEKIVRDVLMHHHTKTCRKFEQICRFFYPRFPSLKTIVSVPFYKLNLTKEEQEAKLESSKKVLKQVKEILEDEEIMDELIKIGSEDIEQYKQLQRGILFLEKLIKDLKREKQRVTIITDENHKDLLRVCLDFEPEDWKFSCNRLTEILDSIKNKLISMKIKISQVEKDRLIALLDTAGLISDNEESALEIYHDALSVSPNGYKIVHKRDIDEIYVNNYNIEWLLCWNANMDLQLCLDFYAVITYISDYFSKDDSGTLGYIKEALRKADNESLKTKLSLVV